MAYEGFQIRLSLAAGADLSSEQFKFVKLNASGQAVICAAATDLPIGVLQNKPDASGKTATVCVVGITKVDSNAALNEADLIGPASDGQADAKVPGTDTTEYICGQMVTATGAAGDYGTAVVNCANAARAA